MAWITPKTDWSNGNRFTYEDANRIAGNINFLYPAANLNDSYTKNDFLSTTDFDAWTANLSALVSVSGLTAVVSGYDGTAETFNSIESLLSDLYVRIQLNNEQKVANIYAGDDLFVSNNGSYGNTENYSRGV